MKGFTEERGRMSRMGYDAETKQFAPQPIAHSFQPSSLPEVVGQKLSALFKGRNLKQAKPALSQQIADMSAEQRDDVGMTEVFATSQPQLDISPFLKN